MAEKTGITAEELAQWKEATERATAGPWEYRPEDDEGFARICTPSLYRFVDIAPDEPETRNDAQFIVLAREAMPRLLAEMDAILFAAHMPADYEYGLPSWINQRLYVRLISLLDRDGQVIRRADDIEALWMLRKQLKALLAEVERLQRQNDRLAFVVAWVSGSLPTKRVDYDACHAYMDSIGLTGEEMDEVKERGVALVEGGAEA